MLPTSQSRITSTTVVALGLWVTNLLGCGSGGDAVSPPDQTPSAVDSLVLNLESADVTIGDTLRLIAIATDAQGLPVPGVALVWSSTNPSVATVSPDGLVTAVAEGEADIEVDIAGASNALASRSGALMNLAESQAQRGKSRAKVIVVQQSACNGALSVKAWDAVFELAYEAKGSADPFEQKFSVKQGSSATAHLTQSQSDASSSYWLGEVKGTARIDNVFTQTDSKAPDKVYKLVERSPGSLLNIGSIAAQLLISNIDGICRFQLKYLERTQWTQDRTYTGAQQAEGFIGAVELFSTLGQKPGANWSFGAENVTLPAMLKSAGPGIPEHPTAYYPASAVPVLLLEVDKKDAGSAKFSYALTAGK